MSSPDAGLRPFGLWRGGRKPLVGDGPVATEEFPHPAATEAALRAEGRAPLLRPSRSLEPEPALGSCPSPDAERAPGLGLAGAARSSPVCDSEFLSTLKFVERKCCWKFQRVNKRHRVW